MELNENQIEAIKEAARSVRFGQVAVTIDETAKSVDVVVTSRVRVPNVPGQPEDLPKSIFHRG